MNEKRSEDRVQLSYFLNVHERESQKLLGQLLDITLNGLNMLSTEPLGAGSTKAILVELPATIQGRARLSLQVECRWCRPDINSSYYSIGFKFDNTKSIDSAVIAELIDEYKFGLGSY